MASRYWPTRDTNLAKRFNDELVGNLKDGKCGIIGHEVILYRVSTYDTETNMYGEAGKGKVYEAGVKLSCIIEAEDFDFNTDEFGPDRVQTVTFSFLRQSLRDIDFVVDVGDVVNWNDGYWEINSKNENQLIGGQTATDSNYSVVCEAYLMRISHLNIERVRSI